MKTKIIMSVMMITIGILLSMTILGFTVNAVANNANKKSNIYQIANNAEVLNEEVAEIASVRIIDIKEENENILEDAQDIDLLNTPTVYNSSIMSDVSSRSNIDRQAINGMYINTNPEAYQEKDYEELIQYIKLEDVKISFDMDVSKTTGLSKEDFVYLVSKMRYDKTGILEKNAAWIWECCQKYSVNEIFILGICGIESGWCSASQHQKTHNYSSLMVGGKLIPYASDEAGFEAMIKLLGQKYLKPGASLYHGKTITSVGRSYCNATTWPKKVYTCMQQVFQ